MGSPGRRGAIAGWCGLVNLLDLKKFRVRKLKKGPILLAERRCE